MILPYDHKSNKRNPALGAIEKRSTADTVFEEIKRMISSGEIKPGKKFPDQYTFAAQLGVSRTCLREALSALTQVGLIEQRPKAGTIVKSAISPYLSEYLSPPFISDRQATTELLEARRYIEIDAVELAVKNATKEEVAELEKLIDRMATAVEPTEGHGRKVAR
jgi:GntR family transcriptional regulator, transcriptional repressor for pyruvate dehydrogenase complex